MKRTLTSIPMVLPLALALNSSCAPDDKDSELDATPPSTLAHLLSEAEFHSLFPQRNPFYTYQGLVEAADSIPGFAKTGDLATQKFELAAFLANVTHETGHLIHIEQIHKEPYCAPSAWAPCASGKWYYGRGPIQISWNYNYKAAGDFLQLPLLEYPEIVSQNPKVAWQTGLWFWMTQKGAGWDTPHQHALRWNFGETVRSINGVQECGANPPNAEGARIRADYLRRITRLLGIGDGGQLGC